MVRSGLINSFNILEQRTDFQDKVVLEIGGDENLSLPKLMVEKGARKVIVSNIDARIKKAENNDAISTKYADALLLSEYFDKDTFDIVFGTAILEHIPDTLRLLQSIYSVLKPGGLVLLHGAPIWSSANGHHLWIRSKDRQYKFSDDDCPIKPWEHLTNTPDTLREKLAEQSELSNEDINNIIKWVYQSGNINRLTSQDIQTAVENSKFRIIQEDIGRSVPNRELFDKARAFVSPEVDIRIHSLRYILEGV